MRYVEVSPGTVALREGPPLNLRPGMVRVMVLACGICGSDLCLLRGMTLPRGASYPVRPGHEVAGLVAEVAEGVRGVRPGDPVVLHPLAPCRTCRACGSGQEQRCPAATVLGLQAPGGMAEEVVWPSDRIVSIAGLAPAVAALLPDAVATAYHAIRLADLGSRRRLCVVGAGGLGTHVLELAAALHPHVEVAAVVRSPATAARLERMGVAAAVGLEGAGTRLRREVGRFDAVIDFSGATGATREALRLLDNGGRLVLGSIADETLDVGTSITGVVTRELEIVGCYASTLQDLRDVVQLYRSDRLPDLPSSVSRTMPLTEAAAAFEVLAERPPATVRVVLEPGR